MGFCLFNNVAVAAQHALDAHGLERVLVLDWDVHHGNGTNDIFHATARCSSCSIHEWPLYPGTGAAADAGSGEGEGYTVNLPVPGGSGDAVFALARRARGRSARAGGTSRGSCSSRRATTRTRDDPLADCAVTESGYRAMTRSLRRRGRRARACRSGVVLEGGYELGALARSVAATLEELAEDEAPPAPEEPLEVAPLARAAAVRHADRWQALAPLVT